MRQAPRDLGPGRVALRFRQLGHIVEDNDAAWRRLARKPRAAHEQRALVIRDIELRLTLPLPVAAGAKAFRDEAREGVESRQPSAPIGKRNVDQVRQRLLQNHRRARIRGTQPECVVESEHARR